jgi:uncharacterized delta-60 repeat protein
LSFGIGGKLNTHLFSPPGFPENTEEIRDIVIQPDGGIVTVGSSNNSSVFARFHADGTPDASFGMSGKAMLQSGSPNAATSVVLQSDGSLIIGGSMVKTNQSYDFMVTRLLPNGTPDFSFGSEGVTTTDFLGTTDTATRVTLLNDGRILQIGMVNTSAVNDFAKRDFGLVCYQANGTHDPAFGNDGKVSTDFFHDYDAAFAIAIQANSRILVAGAAYGGGPNTLGLAAYTLTEPAPQDVPQIQNVAVKGKKLVVTGKNFESPTELYVNGEKQKKTFNDEQSPATTVTALKSGKWILPGSTVTVQVKNSATGKTSSEFSFTRPLE